MLAMIFSWPPQRAQHSISTPNTRFSRLAQLIATTSSWTSSQHFCSRTLWRFKSVALTIPSWRASRQPRLTDIR
jgi:hypothetical protein